MAKTKPPKRPSRNPSIGKRIKSKPSKPRPKPKKSKGY